ncbi:MAG: extracellular solute-binding protein, partial [Clostridia bacterium]|nr:extracellular solute-binding protein [Clostridia bacterium]
EYDDDGNVTVHGVQAGHSGSMGLAISYGSANKKEAWELVKYIAGTEGQTAQSLAGFVIPNQIELANSNVFLQPDQAPKNSQVFVDAASYETPADWWYLTDWHWIDDWADALNNHVREPDAKVTLTVQEMFDQYGDATRKELWKYTYNSHNLDAKPQS